MILMSSLLAPSINDIRLSVHWIEDDTFSETFLAAQRPDSGCKSACEQEAYDIVMSINNSRERDHSI